MRGRSADRQITMKPGVQPPGVSIDTKADERGGMGNLSSTAATKSSFRRSPVRERKVKEATRGASDGIVVLGGAIDGSGPGSKVALSQKAV